MAITPPRLHTNCTTIVDGQNLRGLISAVKPPDSQYTLDSRALAGMDQPIGFRLGMEEQTGTMMLVEPNPQVLGNFGGRVKGMSVLGAYTYETKVLRYTINMQVQFHQNTRPELKAREANEFSFSYTAQRFEEIVEGQERNFIDVFQGIRRINGTDELASIRSHLRI